MNPRREGHHGPSGQISDVLLAGPGGINQVEEPFDRFPQFVLRVAAIATVRAPPVMIPVLVADLAQMSQRRVQVFAELQPLNRLVPGPAG